MQAALVARAFTFRGGDRSAPSHVKRRGIADPSAKAVEFSRMSCLLALLFPKISHERSLTTLVRPLAAACDEASVSIARSRPCSLGAFTLAIWPVAATTRRCHISAMHPCGGIAYGRTHHFSRRVF